MDWWLRALAAIGEALGLVPSTQSSEIPQGIPNSLLDSMGIAYMRSTCIHAGKKNTYKIKIKLNLKKEEGLER